jgi:hypothetical protein
MNPLEFHDRKETEQKSQPLAVTIDFKNIELTSDLLDALRHVAATTTCEDTKAYLVERLEYLTKA